MRERASGAKGARLGLISVAATVFAVLFLLLSAAPAAPPASHQGRFVTDTISITEGACTAAPAAGGACLNQSLPVGAPSGFKEWVSIDNSSTIYYLPLTISGATGTLTVSILNTTTNVIKPVSTIEFRNITATASPVSQNPGSANTTTNVYYATSAGISKVADFAWENYTRVAITAPGLPVTSQGKIVYTVQGAKKTWHNTTALFGDGDTAAFLVQGGLVANFSFNLTASSQSCSTLSACTTTTYTFSSLNVASYNASKGHNDTVGYLGQSIKITAAAVLFNPVFNLTAQQSYEWINLTAHYNTSTSSNTLGGFFSAGNSFIQAVFVNFAWEWILLVVVIVGIVIGTSIRRRR